MVLELVRVGIVADAVADADAGTHKSEPVESKSKVVVVVVVLGTVVVVGMLVGPNTVEVDMTVVVVDLVDTAVDLVEYKMEVSLPDIRPVQSKLQQKVANSCLVVD